MTAVGLPSLRVEYRSEPVPSLLARPGTLAVLGFEESAQATSDPRWLHVPLQAIAVPVPCECWSVDAAVLAGSAPNLRWAAGGGCRFTVVEVEVARPGDVEAASEHAYTLLLEHIKGSAENQPQRIWNYLDAINSGEGDHERYRLFCNGRARGMAAQRFTQYPAATAIGHHGPRGLLQVYALSTTASGHPLENPRQVSAWRYPRQYGPTSPSFARAMRLPNGSLAISGTAAVVGHASHHHDDVAAQADEAFANLHTLLDQAGLPAFDVRSPLKVYVRHADDAPLVEAALARHVAPAVPRLLLCGDICRRELLVEIDGWSNLPGSDRG